MSYEAVYDDDRSIQIASNKGWYDLCEWIRGMQPTKECLSLVDHGFSQDLGALEKELRLSSPAHDPSIESTKKGLYNFVRSRGKAVVLIITGE